jgi:S-(hydroxymethyl)glutathione dehydrogenase/alcohol dehydrogenase
MAWVKHEAKNSSKRCETLFWKRRSELPDIAEDAMTGGIALAPFVTHTMGLTLVNHTSDLMRQCKSIPPVMHF